MACADQADRNRVPSDSIPGCAWESGSDVQPTVLRRGLTGYPDHSSISIVGASGIGGEAGSTMPWLRAHRSVADARALHPGYAIAISDLSTATSIATCSAGN